MAFVAGFRMNDNHSGEHFPFRATFIESHPEWRLRGSGEGSDDFAERMLDFTVDEVRQFVIEAMQEVVSRFDVDGLEMTFREPMYFPVPHGRERAPLMTDLVRRVRGVLDERGRSAGRRILLGARVHSTLEQCLDLGLDVPTWVAEGLIDHLCPMDPMFSDFNAPYEQFAALTRQSQCMLYPGLEPWTSQRARARAHIPLERRVRGSASMTRSNERALAHTFYGAGADGISVYNHFVGHLYPPPLYPQALQVLHELRDPQRVARGDRHYIFEPTWEGSPPFGPDAQRVVLDRSAATPSGVYRFRLYEQADRVRAATLLLRGSLTERDDVDVQLNGTLLAHGPLGRPDPKFLRPFPDIRWFPVPPATMAWGENRLSITLTDADPEAPGEVVIDEVEVWVEPE